MNPDIGEKIDDTQINPEMTGEGFKKNLSQSIKIIN